LPVTVRRTRARRFCRAAARHAFSVPKMTAARVYKVFNGDDEDELFRTVLANLVGLSGYYREVVASRFDLLVEIW